MNEFAVTWWGHSAATVEIGGLRIALDPVLVDWIWHLHRQVPTPAAGAAEAEVVLISHLHSDHLHIPSLQRMRGVRHILAPSGAARLLPRLADLVVEVVPGEQVVLEDLTVDVLSAQHAGRRHPFSTHDAPALGFRVAAANRSFWYPGDTGPHADLTGIAPVDLALIPISGWGPSLGDQHLDPNEAAAMLGVVRARWAVPVHYGTFWPVGLRHVHRSSYHKLFTVPPTTFSQSVRTLGLDTTVLLPAHGERIVLDDGGR